MNQVLLQINIGTRDIPVVRKSVSDVDGEDVGVGEILGGKLGIEEVLAILGVVGVLGLANASTLCSNNSSIYP